MGESISSYPTPPQNTSLTLLVHVQEQMPPDSFWSTVPRAVCAAASLGLRFWGQLSARRWRMRSGNILGSLTYVLLNEVLSHHAWPHRKATTLKIRVHMRLYKMRQVCEMSPLDKSIWCFCLRVDTERHICPDTCAHRVSLMWTNSWEDSTFMIRPRCRRLIWLLHFHCSTITVSSSTQLNHHLEWLH